MSGRTRLAVAAVVAALVLAAGAAPVSAGVLDQEQPYPLHSVGIIGSEGDELEFQAAQTFTANLSGLLDQVDIGVASSAPNVDLTVQIRTVAASGAPTETVLASATVPKANALGNHWGWVEVPFSLPASVIAGTQYAIVLTAPNSGSSVGNNYEWFTGGPSLTYPGGTPWQRLLPDGWSVVFFGVGDPVDFAFKTYVLEYQPSTFAAPIDNTELNLAKAGQSVPVKWRVTDTDGNPVGFASHFKSVTSSGDTCESGPTDEIETYAGGSGLQYLGDGNWQFNWKTPKDYAGQCRTLKLELSNGSTLTADFKFTK